MKYIDKTMGLDVLDTLDLVPSIFLAGPSPRHNLSQGESDWRIEAMHELNKQKFNGFVIAPWPYVVDLKDGDLEPTVKWEDNYLSKASVVLFWIPRDLKELPGFTTNIEFGEYMKSGKVVLAYPETAPKMRYLSVKAKWYNIPEAHTLKDGVSLALEMLKDKGLL
jgi:hypothetical protein